MLERGALRPTVTAQAAAGFGAGLEDAEVRYLYDLVRRTLTS